MVKKPKIKIGPKTPKERLIELEDGLQIGLTPNEYISKFYTRFVSKYIDDDLPLSAKKERFLMLREMLKDVSLIIDMPYDDIKEFIAYAQLRTEALDLLKREMENEEKCTLAVGRAKPTMKESLSLLDTMHTHRKDFSMQVKEEDMTISLGNDDLMRLLV